MRTRIASALSTDPDAAIAAKEAVGRVADALGGATPDLVCVFFSSHHRERAEEVSAVVSDGLGPRALVGATAEAVVGDGREAEDAPGVAVWAAVLPGARIDTFHGRFFRHDGRAGFVGIPDLLQVPDLAAVVLLAEPFSFPAAGLLRYAADRFPGVTFVGGMASGGIARDEHRLLRDGEVHTTGAVGVLIRGDVSVRTVVSQGCKPVGPTFVVTKAERNVIHELAGRPAVEQLEEVIRELSPDDRRRAERGMHLGIVVDEYQEDFGTGDFLIRAIVGADPRTGAVEIGEVVQVGQTVRFHVRDAGSASEDLADALRELEVAPSGGLLFTCNGRGSRMFVLPDHDAQRIREAFGDVPVAGMLCQGEIGPIGGRSHLHGFTASMVFFS